MGYRNTWVDGLSESDVLRETDIGVLILADVDHRSRNPERPAHQYPPSPSPSNIYSSLRLHELGPPISLPTARIYFFCQSPIIHHCPQRPPQESKFLADINNERPTKNAQYKANLASLDLYVLIEATKDTMIYPHQSESHGYYRWTAEDPKGTLQLMRDTQAFSEDWIGLKTLDAAGKIKQMSYPGQHMALPSTMWRAQVMPFFDTKFPPAGESAEEGEERGEQGKRSFKVDVFV